MREVDTTVEYWWNQHWGRMARRNIWLKTDGTSWRVEARAGDSDSHTWHRDCGDEAAARALITEMQARSGDTWKRLT
jgi:hypothetical protein